MNSASAHVSGDPAPTLLTVRATNRRTAFVLFSAVGESATELSSHGTVGKGHVVFFLRVLG